MTAATILKPGEAARSATLPAIASTYATTVRGLLAPDFSRMPPELRKLPRWVVWRDKVPYCATAANSRASSTDPSTWASFDQAQAAYEEGGWDGVGFVFNGDGVVGIDLDDCVTDDVIAPAALAILEESGAQYVELSPSGAGLHALGYGERPARCRGVIDGANVEMYATDRYFTMTGHVLLDGPLVPMPGVASVADRIEPVKQKAGSDSSGATQGTQGHREHRSSCVPCVPCVAGVEIPPELVPTGNGQRNDWLFKLARYVKGKRPGATLEERREIVRAWHRLALPYIDTKDFATSWGDFSRSWETVHTPYGATLEEIVARADGYPIPEAVAGLDYGEKTIRLVQICQALHAHHGGTFYLSARTAGGLLGVDYSVASRMLAALCADGVVALVSKGVRPKASTYRMSEAPHGT